ncbi:hypothetical protein Tco_0902867, partial [Tanacetum coccineum]
RNDIWLLGSNGCNDAQKGRCGLMGRSAIESMMPACETGCFTIQVTFHYSTLQSSGQAIVCRSLSWIKSQIGPNGF